VDYGSLSVVDIEPEKRTPVQVQLFNFCPWRD
jgi:hypothetical protein